MKRVIDILISLFSLILLAPLFLFIAIWIKTDSEGPVFFRQLRVGRKGKDFSMYKFRTMYRQSETRGLLTVGHRDPRITRAGYFLRKYKLDELPQLMNVLTGTMSMVGPRPEVRKYVNLYSEDQKKILRVKPGITDEASIFYRNESAMLAQSGDPEQTYITIILPHKIALNMNYINNPSFLNYLRITFRTIGHVLAN